MRLNDFKDMKFSGKKVFIDRDNKNVSIEIEGYSNPQDKKEYQVNREFMVYRVMDSQGDFSEWRKIEEPPLSEKFKQLSTSFVESTTKLTDDSLKFFQKKYQDSPAKKGVDAVAEKVDEVLDKTGVKNAAVKASEVVGEHLDTITGHKILVLVEERLSLQAKYNDILATKLDEALGRIEELESKLPKMEK